MYKFFFLILIKSIFKSHSCTSFPAWENIIEVSSLCCVSWFTIFVTFIITIRESIIALECSKICEPSLTISISNLAVGVFIRSSIACNIFFIALQLIALGSHACHVIKHGSGFDWVNRKWRITIYSSTYKEHRRNCS